MLNWWSNLTVVEQRMYIMAAWQLAVIILAITCAPSTKPKADFADSWQLSFQDPASPIMEGIINLHHDIMFILVFVAVFVITVMYFIIVHFEHTEYTPKFSYEPLMHNTKLEFIWTLVPCLILMLLAMPSFALIYSLDDMATAKMTIKVIGHQWYWTYEYGEIADEILY